MESKTRVNVCGLNDNLATITKACKLALEDDEKSEVAMAMQKQIYSAKGRDEVLAILSEYVDFYYEDKKREVI